jgi:hypothetical protein
MSARKKAAKKPSGMTVLADTGAISVGGAVPSSWGHAPDVIEPRREIIADYDGTLFGEMLEAIRIIDLCGAVAVVEALDESTIGLRALIKA